MHTTHKQPINPGELLVVSFAMLQVAATAAVEPGATCPRYADRI